MRPPGGVLAPGESVFATGNEILEKNDVFFGFVYPN